MRGGEGKRSRQQVICLYSNSATQYVCARAQYRACGWVRSSVCVCVCVCMPGRDTQKKTRFFFFVQPKESNLFCCGHVTDAMTANARCKARSFCGNCWYVRRPQFFRRPQKHRNLCHTYGHRYDSLLCQLKHCKMTSRKGDPDLTGHSGQTSSSCSSSASVRSQGRSSVKPGHACVSA